MRQIHPETPVSIDGGRSWLPAWPAAQSVAPRGDDGRAAVDRQRRRRVRGRREAGADARVRPGRRRTRAAPDRRDGAPRPPQPATAADDTRQGPGVGLAEARGVEVRVDRGRPVEAHRARAVGRDRRRRVREMHHETEVAREVAVTCAGPAPHERRVDAPVARRGHRDRSRRARLHRHRLRVAVLLAVGRRTAGAHGEDARARGERARGDRASCSPSLRNVGAGRAARENARARGTERARP